MHGHIFNQINRLTTAIPRHEKEKELQHHIRMSKNKNLGIQLRTDIYAHPEMHKY
jgi:hypothetical protein